jgi:hypothetical protein
MVMNRMAANKFFMSILPKKGFQGSCMFFVTTQVAGFGVQGSENPVGLAP